MGSTYSSVRGSAVMIRKARSNSFTSKASKRDGDLSCGAGMSLIDGLKSNDVPSGALSVLRLGRAWFAPFGHKQCAIENRSIAGQSSGRRCGRHGCRGRCFSSLRRELTERDLLARNSPGTTLRYRLACRESSTCLEPSGRQDAVVRPRCRDYT